MAAAGHLQIGATCEYVGAPLDILLTIAQTKGFVSFAKGNENSIGP